MFVKRVITAIILIPLVVLGVFYLPSLYFGMAIAVILSLAAWEWSRLSGLVLFWQRILYIGLLWWGFSIAQLLPNMVILWASFIWWLFAFYLVIRFPNIGDYISNKWLTRCIIGFFVFVPCLQALMILHRKAPLYVLFVLCIIWAADIGAYFIGSKYGKHKLAPKVSPGKTIEGLYGGLGLALVIAVIFGLATQTTLSKWLLWALIVVVTVLFAVVGDLFESVFKRLVDVKDSGTWLPGHGGVLDRIDSLTAAIPVFTLGLLLLIK